MYVLANCNAIGNNLLKMQSLEDIIIQEVKKRPNLYKIGKIDVGNKNRDFEDIAKFIGMKHIKGIFSL